MEPKMDDQKRFVQAAGICGIIAVLIFMGVALVLEQFYWQKLPAKNLDQILTLMGRSPNVQINMAGHIAIGFAFLLFAVALLGVRRLMEIEKPRISVTLGTLFGIISCPIMTVQMLVQGTVMVKLGKMCAAAADEPERQTIILLYRGLRNFDIGIDLAFDMFFFPAWILLGLAMLRSRSFGKVLGAFGLIFFAVTAVLNLWSAPTPPRLELSPIGALWVLVVFNRMLRSAKSLKVPEKK
jgi:hypothetical protein